MNAALRKIFFAQFVVSFVFFSYMRISINLDRELPFWTIEIQNKISYAELAAKFITIDLARP